MWAGQALAPSLHSSLSQRYLMEGILGILDGYLVDHAFIDLALCTWAQLCWQRAFTIS